MDKAVAVTLVVYYHFSSLRVVLHLRKDAQGTCECSTVSPSSQLCCVYLHLSLNHMMNRRPPPSLVVIGWLVRETLTSCILSKHNTTILKQSMHTSVCSTISMHIFKGALHIFYTLKSVSAMRSTIQREQSEKVTLMMSSGVIFSYLSLGLDSAFFNDKLVLQTGIRSLKGTSIY